MNKLDILRLSTRVFRTNMLRTGLTILGIGVGIGAILFLVSLGFGMQRLMLNQISNSDSLLSLDVYSDSSSLIELDADNMDKIKAIPEIASVSPLATLQSQIEINSLSGSADLSAVDPSYFSLADTKTSAGSLFADGESHKIVVTSGILKAFGLPTGEEALGNVANLKVYFSEEKQNEDGSTSKENKEINMEEGFEIIGVIDDEYSSYAYVPLSDISSLGIGEYSSAKIKAKSQEDVETVRTKVSALGFSVSAVSDSVEEVNKVFQMIQIVLSLFGAVALLVSAIGMFNTMTIALLERTKEIGIMKSLGASNRDVWKLFLVEAILIGFLGGASGILVGLLASNAFNFFINKLAGFLGGEQVSLFYTPVEFVVIIMVFATVVGALTGFYPSRRAAKLNALDALRYK